MSEAPKDVFTLGEVRAFRHLAIVQGVVACGVAFVADAPLFAVLFATGVMVVVPLLVYGLRRLRNRGRHTAKA